MTGVHITYPGRKSHFWYPCLKKQVAEVIQAHAANWKWEQVGDETRPIPPFLAVFCQDLREVDGEAVPVEPEVIDVDKVLTNGR